MLMLLCKHAKCLALNRVSYNGGGMHLPAVTRHTEMPKAPPPALNGDPFTFLSAPLDALMV